MIDITGYINTDYVELSFGSEIWESINHQIDFGVISFSVLIFTFWIFVIYTMCRH